MIGFFLLLGIYPFALYPAIVWMVSKFVDKRIDTLANDYSVTVVIAAFNEVECIGETIANKLAQNFPAEKLDVIVVSDASTDGTDELVREAFASSGRVKLIRQETRMGKTSALNLAVESSSADIIVFSDANSIYDNSAVRELVSCFADHEVGYVTGRMIYTQEDGSDASDGSAFYMRFENWLRTVETKIGSIVGADGGIDAVRRSLYSRMRQDQLPDFVLPLSIVRQYSRCIYHPTAVLHEKSLANASNEFRMRVRVATRALWALLDNLTLLNPIKYGIYSWQLLSHKWLRYLAFIPLSIVIVLTMNSPWNSQFVFGLAMLEIAFFGAASLGLFFPRIATRFLAVRAASFFLLLNAASAVALMNVMLGRRFVTWKPRVN